MAVTNPWHDVSCGKDAPRVVNAIIEIPKGSQQKFEFDKDTGLLKLDRTLYSAVHYPGDYGFIPRTLWEDGDPLDVIILTSLPVPPLTLAEVRVIGVLRMVDDGERDDKLIAVYESDPRFKEYENVTDIPKHTLRELKHFFETYKHLQGKKCEIPEVLGREDAQKSVELGQIQYKLQFEKKEVIEVNTSLSN